MATPGIPAYGKHFTLDNAPKYLDSIALGMAPRIYRARQADVFIQSDSTSKEWRVYDSVYLREQSPAPFPTLSAAMAAVVAWWQL